MSLSPLPRRRNGRPQACEPCRKRKIACDHSLPVCGRCKRRKAIASCVYLPAPMTQNPESLVTEHEQEIPNISALPALDIASPGLTKRALGNRLEIGSKRLSTGTGGVGGLASVFFGPTSFSAVFHEDLGTDFRANAGDMGVNDAQQQKSGLQNDPLDAHFVRLGTKVLSRLPNQQTCNLLLERYLHTNENDGWFKPATKQFADLLYSLYGKYLSGSRSIADIEYVAGVLCQNARIALQEPDDPDDSRDWIAAFSGSNLRWEALGIVLSSCCYGALASPGGDMFTCLDGTRREKDQFVRELKESISICVTLCSHTDSVNVVMVALLYNNCLLLSILGAGGDASFLLWRHHGDLVSATTALGLHRESDSRKNKVTIGSEVRRRIYSSVYSIDKSLASFTGRPPFLSHRYSICPLPLDLNDEQLLQNREERAKAVARLDSYGWNTDGFITPATFLRVNMLLSLIKDEILEISLGSWNECLPNCIYAYHIIVNTPVLLANMHKRLKGPLREIYAGFPPYMKYEAGDSSEPTIKGMATRSKYLQNHFLLERLAMKYGETDGQTLLDISREMLNLTLILYTNRDQYIGRHHNYEWLIVCYGVPASGILCLELLKQSKSLNGPRLNLPRSETIQNLSMFIGFLNWVRPAAPNYEICCRMRDIISKILDEILEVPSSSMQSKVSLESEPAQGQEELQQVGFDVGMAVPAQVSGNWFDFDAFGEF